MSRVEVIFNKWGSQGIQKLGLCQMSILTQVPIHFSCSGEWCNPVLLWSPKNVLCIIKPDFWLLWGWVDYGRILIFEWFDRYLTSSRLQSSPVHLKSQTVVLSFTFNDSNIIDWLYLSIHLIKNVTAFIDNCWVIENAQDNSFPDFLKTFFCSCFCVFFQINSLNKTFPLLCL